ELVEENKTKWFLTLPQIRPYVQGFFLLFFVVLFIRISYPLHDHITRNFFFNLDPLIPLVMTLSGTVVLTGLFISAVTVIITVLLGRIFCGWVCPMGTVFDLFAHVIPQKKERPPFGNGYYKNIKYYLLTFLIFGSIAGFSAVLFFDPLVFLFRVFTLNVYPFIVLIINLGLDTVRPLAMKMGFFTLSTFSYEQPVFILGLVNLLMFIGIIAFIYVERRFWCRNLCPLGALLSLFSRFSVWGRRVSEECIDCSKCARTCPMNAISDDYKSTSLRECIQCERCKPVCSVDAVSFSTRRNEIQRFEFNPARRSIIFSGLGGLLAGFTGGSTAATKTTHGALLRPPGALVEKDFLDACLRCGECMKVCPTHALQPAKFQAGFEGLFTPVLTPRIGGCEELCNLCGQVCPTGAVRKLSLEEKQYAVIGNAAIERNLCIAWEQLKVCLICDEVCPYDAVEFKMVTDEKGTLQRPFVNEDKCVGCGQCEHGCPVKGPAAIHVTPVNEVRKNSGTYITEKVKKLREVDDEGVDFYEDSEFQIPAEDTNLQPWEQPQESEDGLPPGFIE
ncbi:4Fe-4S binding protein, partial [Candidatus Latescibacterota bacterium]